MVNIIYRHFQEGDDPQLADLFNRAFQMNGLSVIRTPKNWNWRYFQSPSFEPEMCQIAEEIEQKKIVGAVYVNLIEKISFNGIEYLVGEINDVSCHPDFIKRGIATNLMKMAINYMEKKGCDISILGADYDGHARKKIYLKLGYFDVDRGYTFLQFPNLFKLTKDIIALAILFPVFFTISYIPRFLSRLRIKYNNFFKKFSWEINDNKRHIEFLEAVNEIIPKYYAGFPLYSKRKFEWARMKVPAKRQRPTYIMIKKRTKIIGGAVITHQNIYAFKYGIKFRIGIIHDIFLDKTQFTNKKNLHLGYIYLIDKIIKAATQRNIGILTYMATSKDFDLHKALKGMNFFKLKGQTTMIKPIKKNIKITNFFFKKPLFLPTYVSLGVP
ncbi:MAG: GNAT family N-acetyltransferase [Candidatus Thorarchaeota archaeon]